jgi:hypothetical protein
LEFAPDTPAPAAESTMADVALLTAALEGRKRRDGAHAELEAAEEPAKRMPNRRELRAMGLRRSRVAKAHGLPPVVTGSPGWRWFGGRPRHESGA